MTYTGKNGTRPTERPNERNCRDNAMHQIGVRITNARPGADATEEIQISEKNQQLKKLPKTNSKSIDPKENSSSTPAHRLH